VPVLKVIAATGAGVPELAEAIDAVEIGRAHV
jgi:hypothetical protein